MSDFWIYYEIGMRHVLNIHAYDHVLFLIALSVPYSFKEWKRLLVLVSIFTLGHTLALLLAVFGMISVQPRLIEFLIPITILITAVSNLFTAGKSAKTDGINIIGFITLFFGIIHGLGFSNYFNSLIGGSSKSRLLPLSEFALGIESAQLIVVVVALLLSYLVQSVFRFSKRDWTLVVCSFIIGVVLPLIIGHEIWKK